MSGAKCASYKLDMTILVDEHRDWAEVEATRSEERRRRQGAQDRQLDTQLLRWQVSQLHQALSSLADECDALQACQTTGRIPHVTVQPMPETDSPEVLRHYLADAQSAIVSARARIQEILPVLTAASAMRSPLSDNNSPSDAPATARDALAEDFHTASPEPDPTMVGIQALQVLRDQVLESIGQFRKDEKCGVSDEVQARLERLYSAVDESEAASLAFAIQNALDARRSARDNDRRDATQLLKQLPDSKHPDVLLARSRLDEVCQHLADLTPEIKASVGAAIEAERSARAAAAAILQRTLEDLGYDVEPIEETLFTSGGTANFRKSEWSDGYFVRLRADAAQMNFDVVRVPQENKTADPKEDERVENAWSAGISKFQDSLASHGIGITITKASRPGAMPVRLVQPEALKTEFWKRRAAKAQPVAQASLQRANHKEIGS